MQTSIWTHKLQRIWKPFYLPGLLIISFLLLNQSPSEAYIAKRYSVERIVKESSNILFGTVSEVNTKRRTAKVKVEKYLKGNAEFDEIRIRLDVYKGEVDHRDEAMRLMKLDAPIIVFYLKEGGRIDSLAHVSGKWFQTQTTRQGGNWGWWLFTHTEKYLNRDEISRRDSTVDFQRELDAMLGKDAMLDKDAVQVHFLRTDSYKAEYRAIFGINSIGKHWIAYNGTTKSDLPGLSKADILWLGFRTLSRDGKYRLNNKQETRIKEFVKNGGVAIVSGQDSDDGRPCPTGWLPESINGIESAARSDFQATANAGELFNVPNRIRSGNLSLDDSWTGANGNYQVLATTNNGKEIAIAKRNYGKGMYLITSLRNDTEMRVSKNRQMLENLVHFAVDFLEANSRQPSAVSQNSQQPSETVSRREPENLLTENRRSPKAILVLKTDAYASEPRTIARLEAITGSDVVYQETTNGNLPTLSNADILWLGFRTLSRDGKYRLNNSQEARIKEFVKNGGVAIVSGQDSDDGRPCQTGWLPEPLNGVESTQRNDFQPTSAAGDLFNTPHRVRSGQLALDDSWSGWNQNYQVLATTNDGKEIVVAKLKYGKGMYLITNLRNSREGEVSKNRPMLENLVHFAVDFLADSK